MAYGSSKDFVLLGILHLIFTRWMGGQYQWNTGGLCLTLLYVGDDLYDRERSNKLLTHFRTMFPNWEHYSGHPSYPLPGAADGYYQNDVAGHGWDRSKKYGAMRFDLLKHCMATLTARIKKRDDMYQQLRVLLEVRETVHDGYLYAGTCALVRRIACTTTTRDEIRQRMARWPEHSGADLYPVPSYKAGVTPYGMYMETARMWDRSTEYGAARWRLLDWLIADVREEIASL